MFSTIAFTAPLTQSLFTQRKTQTAICNRSIPTRSAVIMQDRTKPSTNVKKKKDSSLSFAKDIKGNPVWTLRSATVDDVSELSTVLGSSLPSSLVGSFVEDSSCCTVCDMSVKGKKEGSGFSSRIMGGVLVDVSTEVKDPAAGADSGVVKRGELVTLAVDPQVPDADDVAKKLVLGSLVKMKEEGVFEVVSSVSEENEKRLALLTSCLFDVKATSRGRVTLICRLSAENPDPKKRMS